MLYTSLYDNGAQTAGLHQSLNFIPLSKANKKNTEIDKLHCRHISSSPLLKDQKYLKSCKMQLDSDKEKLFLSKHSDIAMATLTNCN